MIRFLRNDEIDKSRWDACIASVPNGLVYANSWYLDTVCPGWCALVDDSWESVFPLPSGYKYFMHYLYPPFFTQQLGLFSMWETTSELVREFTDAIPSRYRYMEIQLNASNGNPGGFTVQPRMNHILELSPTYEELQKNYSENHSRSIKRAVREGVVVNENGKASDVIRLFRKGRGSTLENLGDRQYALFESLVSKVQQHAKVDVQVATNSSGHLVAGVVFFNYRNRRTLIFSGTIEEGKAVSAAHLLVDHYIGKIAGKQGILDFEGSDNANLARFYKSFGSKESPYLKLTMNRLPIPWKWFK
jgi:hypothetical protein